MTDEAVLDAAGMGPAVSAQWRRVLGGLGAGAQHAAGDGHEVPAMDSGGRSAPGWNDPQPVTGATAQTPGPRPVSSTGQAVRRGDGAGTQGGSFDGLTVPLRQAPGARGVVGSGCSGGVRIRRWRPPPRQLSRQAQTAATPPHRGSDRGRRARVVARHRAGAAAI